MATRFTGVTHAHMGRGLVWREISKKKKGAGAAAPAGGVSKVVQRQGAMGTGTGYGRSCPFASVAVTAVARVPAMKPMPVLSVGST